jgi:hypothetical protein
MKGSMFRWKPKHAVNSSDSLFTCKPDHAIKSSEKKEEKINIEDVMTCFGPAEHISLAIISEELSKLIKRNDKIMDYIMKEAIAEKRKSFNENL